MAKELRCRDLGIECNQVIQAETEASEPRASERRPGLYSAHSALQTRPFLCNTNL
jgi:hypothetical protein